MKSYSMYAKESYLKILKKVKYFRQIVSNRVIKYHKIKLNDGWEIKAYTN